MWVCACDEEKISAHIVLEIKKLKKQCNCTLISPPLPHSHRKPSIINWIISVAFSVLVRFVIPKTKDYKDCDLHTYK